METKNKKIEIITMGSPDENLVLVSKEVSKITRDHKVVALNIRTAISENTEFVHIIDFVILNDDEERVKSGEQCV